MLVRKTSALMAITIGLTGCGSGITWWDRVKNGEPVISDSVWLRVPLQVQDTDSGRADYIPTTCLNHPSTNTGGALTQIRITDPDHTGGYGFVSDQVAIASCVSDMKTLIDRRFDQWMDTLASTVSSSNAALDVTVIGAGLAGGLAGGITSQVMNAVGSGLTGTKTTINQDIFLSQSLQVIITQMSTDRSKWATIIESKVQAGEATTTTGVPLKSNPIGSSKPADKVATVTTSTKTQTNTTETLQPPVLPYFNLSDAMNDLQTYSRQGSFQNALYNIQTNASAQSAACQSDNLNFKSGNPSAGQSGGTQTMTPSGSSASPTTKCQIGASTTPNSAGSGPPKK